MREKLETKIALADQTARIYLRRAAKSRDDVEFEEYLLNKAGESLIRREHLKKMLATLTEIENAAL